MPLLTLGFFCLRTSTTPLPPVHVLICQTELDRGNIANAITDDFMEDVGINQDQFNVGQQMLSLGIVLFEIPSNMILYRVGPGKWLTLQLFLFGTVSTFQAFQNSYGSFIATRFLLGMTESGFIPGGLWTLSTWYTRKETAKRVMFFYFGNQFGQASSKLLAYGILHMRGVGGHAGWFWLFVLMGTFTILSGFILGFCLPDSFKNPRSTFLPNVSFFTERELHILQTRVLIDDPMKGKKKKRIGLDAFKKAVSIQPRVNFTSLLTNWCPSSPTGVFGLIYSSPWPTTDLSAPLTRTPHPLLGALALASLPATPWPRSASSSRSPCPFRLAMFRIICRLPNWTQEITDTDCNSNRRGETVIAGLSCHLLGYVFNRVFTEISKRGLRYFGVVWTQTFGTFSHPLNIAWMSLACDDSEERALAMAM